MRPLPLSKKVETLSSNTSRTAPVAASARRSCSRLWSREVETNASFEPSGLHWTSAHSLDGGDHAIARQRILPCAQVGMPGARIDQVHFTNAALVLLEGRDLFRI